MKKSIIIAGPTGSGKSAVALRLALKFNGEIICADSRQIYSDMDIASNSPQQEEKDKVPHHLFGHFDPAIERADTGKFLSLVQEKIKLVNKKNKRAIIVGGTGLYLRALMYGLGEGIPKTSLEVMKIIDEKEQTYGLLNLWQELISIDNECASKISCNDEYRIKRALAIFYETGKKPSSLRTNFASCNKKLDARCFLLLPSIEDIEQKLLQRASLMFAKGIVKEALALKQKVKDDSWILNTMGVFEALQVADKVIDEKEAIYQTYLRHRKYAKRQITWFKKEKFYKILKVCI